MRVTQELKDSLETLLDNSTLETLLSALSDVCYEKAEHLLSAWQDRATSKAWSHAAKQVDTLSAHSAIRQVS